MKIKLDENLPEALVVQLAELGHEVDNVRLEKINGQPDPIVLQAAQKAGRFFITQAWIFRTSGSLPPACIMA